MVSAVRFFKIGLVRSKAVSPSLHWKSLKVSQQQRPGALLWTRSAKRVVSPYARNVNRVRRNDAFRVYVTLVTWTASFRLTLDLHNAQGKLHARYQLQLALTSLIKKASDVLILLRPQLCSRCLEDSGLWGSSTSRGIISMVCALRIPSRCMLVIFEC